MAVEVVMGRSGGVSEKKIRIPPTPVSLAHFPQGTPSVIWDVNAVEEGKEGKCQPMCREFSVVGEGVIEPVSAIDAAVNIRGKGVIVQARDSREVMGERGKRVTEEPVSFRYCKRERLSDVMILASCMERLEEGAVGLARGVGGNAYCNDRMIGSEICN